MCYKLAKKEREEKVELLTPIITNLYRNAIHDIKALHDVNSSHLFEYNWIIVLMFIVHPSFLAFCLICFTYVQFEIVSTHTQIQFHECA